MRLNSVSIAQFASVIRSCQGRVCLETSEGDCIRSDSLLFSVIGLSSFFKVAETQDIKVTCDHPDDQEKVDRFMKAQQLSA